MDIDETYHMAKAIWRACAELQVTIEQKRAAAALDSVSDDAIHRAATGLESPPQNED
jgi:hypothetical protein